MGCYLSNPGALAMAQRSQACRPLFDMPPISSLVAFRASSEDLARAGPRQSPPLPSLCGKEAGRGSGIYLPTYLILESHLPSRLPPSDLVPLQSPGWVSQFGLFGSSVICPLCGWCPVLSRLRPFCNLAVVSDLSAYS